jgi:hypothetical protein
MGGKSDGSFSTQDAKQPRIEVFKGILRGGKGGNGSKGLSYWIIFSKAEFENF